MRLTCCLAVDRYELAREFELQKFEMQIMQCTDLYKVQETCVKLFAQTISQRKLYEQLLRDTLPKLP